MSVERLLQWAFGEQKVHLGGSGHLWPAGDKMSPVYGMAALGVTVQGSAAENKVAPDALEVEAAVLRVAGGLAWNLVVPHAVAGTRPSVPVAPRAVMYRSDEFGNPLGSPDEIVYVTAQTRKGRTKKIGCYVVFRLDPSPEGQARQVEDWLAWRGCLAAVREALMAVRLDRFVLTEELPDLPAEALAYRAKAAAMGAPARAAVDHGAPSRRRAWASEAAAARSRMGKT